MSRQVARRAGSAASSGHGKKTPLCASVALHEIPTRSTGGQWATRARGKAKPAFQLAPLAFLIQFAPAFCGRQKESSSVSMHLQPGHWVRGALATAQHTVSSRAHKGSRVFKGTLFGGAVLKGDRSRGLGACSGAAQWRACGLRISRASGVRLTLGYTVWTRSPPNTLPVTTFGPL